MAGRSPHWSKKWAHQKVGKKRNETTGSQRRALSINLCIRGHLPRPRQRGCSCFAQSQYKCHTVTSGRDQPKHYQRGAAVVLMDQAGWHTTAKLKLPDNITILLLPSRSPKLNPVENIWQYLRQNWLSNRSFENYQEIVDAACNAWNKLVQQPHTITSIGYRNWASVGQS